MFSKEIAEKLKVTAKHDHAAIDIKECNEALVNIKGSVKILPFWLDSNSLIQSVEGRFYSAYIEHDPNFELQVRKSVLERLLLAEQYLPNNWEVVLRAGFRPAQVQEAMFADYLEQTISVHEDWSLQECTLQAEQYISNPKRTVPPHVTGAAIDIEIRNMNNDEVVDMGGKICELNELSHCFSSLLSNEQRSNQDCLVEAMCKAGFAPFATEWWHFSYGDQRWANFYQKDFAMYGEARTKGII